MVGFAPRFVKQGFQGALLSDHSNNPPGPSSAPAQTPSTTSSLKAKAMGLPHTVTRTHADRARSVLLHISPRGDAPPLFPAGVQRWPSDAVRCAITKGGKDVPSVHPFLDWQKPPMLDCRVTSAMGYPFYCLCRYTYKLTWGCGAVGSAREWHSRGRRFNPGQLHQKKLVRPMFRMNAGISDLYESYAWPAISVTTDADTPQRVFRRALHSIHRVLLIHASA